MNYFLNGNRPLIMWLSVFSKLCSPRKLLTSFPHEKKWIPSSQRHKVATCEVKSGTTRKSSPNTIPTYTKRHRRTLFLVNAGWQPHYSWSCYGRLIAYCKPQMHYALQCQLRTKRSQKTIKCYPSHMKHMLVTSNVCSNYHFQNIKKIPMSLCVRKSVFNFCLCVTTHYWVLSA